MLASENPIHTGRRVGAAEELATGVHWRGDVQNQAAAGEYPDVEDDEEELDACASSDWTRHRLCVAFGCSHLPRTPATSHAVTIAHPRAPPVA